jgi:hypothetical protein
MQWQYWLETKEFAQQTCNKERQSKCELAKTKDLFFWEHHIAKV